MKIIILKLYLRVMQQFLSKCFACAVYNVSKNNSKSNNGSFQQVSAFVSLNTFNKYAEKK